MIVTALGVKVKVKVRGAVVVYLQQAAVALLALLQVEVPTASSAQQPLRLRNVEQTHPPAVQQADRQVGRTAAAELLPRQEAGGHTSQCQHATHWGWQEEEQQEQQEEMGRRWEDSEPLQVNYEMAMQKQRPVQQLTGPLALEAVRDETLNSRRNEHNEGQKRALSDETSRLVLIACPAVSPEVQRHDGKCDMLKPRTLSSHGLIELIERLH